MIGKQLGLFLSAQDQTDLLERIRNEAGCVLVKRTDTCDYFATEDLRRTGEDWASAFLCRKHDAEQVLRQISGPNYVGTHGEVIEFAMPMLEGNRLRRGRFWYSEKYAEGGIFVCKSMEFVEWAKKVFRITKAGLKTVGAGNLIGSEARELSDRSVLLLTDE